MACGRRRRKRVPWPRLLLTPSSKPSLGINCVAAWCHFRQQQRVSSWSAGAPPRRGRDACTRSFVKGGGKARTAIGTPFRGVLLSLRERPYLDGPAYASGRDPSSEFEDGVVVVALEHVEAGEDLPRV